MALLSGCPHCGARVPASAVAACRLRTCPTCHGPFLVATPPPDDAPAEVPPAPPRDAASGRSPVGSAVAGAAKGLAVPFVAGFVLVVDLGINSLLGNAPSGVNDQSVASSLSRSAALRGVVVLAFAVLAAAVGGFAGDAAAHTQGAVGGAVAGFLAGCMVAGAVAELLTRDRG